MKRKHIPLLLSAATFLCCGCSCTPEKTDVGTDESAGTLTEASTEAYDAFFSQADGTTDAPTSVEVVEPDSTTPETEAVQNETEVPTEAVTEENGVPDGTVDLRGFWQYVDGEDTGIAQFTDTGFLVYYEDVSHIMHLENGRLVFDDVIEEPGTWEVHEVCENGQLRIALVDLQQQESTMLLILEPVGGQEASSLSGGYALVDAFERLEFHALTHFYIGEETILGGFAADYEWITEDAMTMTYQGDAVDVTIEAAGDHLMLISADGQSVYMSRME